MTLRLIRFKTKHWFCFVALMATLLAAVRVNRPLVQAVLSVGLSLGPILVISSAISNRFGKGLGWLFVAFVLLAALLVPSIGGRTHRHEIIRKYVGSIAAGLAGVLLVGSIQHGFQKNRPLDRHQSGAEASHLTSDALLKRRAVGMYAPVVTLDASMLRIYRAKSFMEGRCCSSRMRILPMWLHRLRPARFLLAR